jgi:hypothetical protein
MSTTKDSQTKPTTPVATTQPKPGLVPTGNSSVPSGDSDYPNETGPNPPPPGPSTPG